MCEQKLLHVYVLPYFTHCMEVACWHKGEKDVQQPKNPNKKLMTVIKFSRANLLNRFVFCACLI